jgi:DEAD/DEAH box helicase domain-containing protein
MDMTGLTGVTDPMDPAASTGLPGRADIREYIAALKASQRLGHLVAHHEVLPPGPAREAACRRPWPVPVERLLAGRGIPALYEHQARAMDLLRAGRNVVVATPTASGKTLIYTLPVLEQQLMNPTAGRCTSPPEGPGPGPVALLRGNGRPWPEDTGPGRPSTTATPRTGSGARSATLRPGCC